MREITPKQVLSLSRFGAQGLARSDGRIFSGEPVV